MLHYTAVLHHTAALHHTAVWCYREGAAFGSGGVEERGASRCICVVTVVAATLLYSHHTVMLHYTTVLHHTAVWCYREGAAFGSGEWWRSVVGGGAPIQ